MALRRGAKVLATSRRSEGRRRHLAERLAMELDDLVVRPASNDWSNVRSGAGLSEIGEHGSDSTVTVRSGVEVEFGEDAAGAGAR